MANEGVDIRELLSKATPVALGIISFLAGIAQLEASSWGKPLLIVVAVASLQALIVLIFVRPLKVKISQLQSALRRTVNQPPITLLEESLELVVTIGARSGQDSIIQRHQTTAEPSLGYRVIKPIVTRGGRVTTYAQLMAQLHSMRDDVQVSDLTLSEGNRGIELYVMFKPAISGTTGWRIEYSPPRLFDDLRSDGEDTLGWNPRIARRNVYPERLLKLTVQFIFPSNAKKVSVSEIQKRGSQETSTLPAGQTRVVWVDEAPSPDPSAEPYLWTLNADL